MVKDYLLKFSNVMLAATEQLGLYGQSAFCCESFTLLNLVNGLVMRY